MATKITQHNRRVHDQSLKEIKDMLKEINTRLNGDYVIYPPVKGHEQRIIDLEKSDAEREKGKERIMSMLVGSVTIAIGSIVIGICMAVRAAFIKH